MGQSRECTPSSRVVTSLFKVELESLCRCPIYIATWGCGLSNQCVERLAESERSLEAARQKLEWADQEQERLKGEAAALGAETVETGVEPPPLACSPFERDVLVCPAPCYLITPPLPRVPCLIRSHLPSDDVLTALTCPPQLEL